MFVGVAGRAAGGDSEQRTEVLVVGAGPVGLCTALGLRRFGIDCVVVDRHPSTLDFPKGRGVLVRPFEIFRQWGIEGRVREVCVPPEEARHQYFGETVLADRFERTTGSRALGGEYPHSPTYGGVCSQERLEPVLLRAALDAGAVVVFLTRLVGVTQDGSGVVAALRDETDGEGRTINARYLVAADGARSTVRELVGITVRDLAQVTAVAGRGGTDRVETLSILFATDLRDRLADRRASMYWVDRPRPGTTMVIVDSANRWLLMVPTSPAELAAAGPITEEMCRTMVHQALGDEAMEIEVLGWRRWRFGATLADRYSTGRVFLAGDAAHVTTPAGGLGMTTGIADAHNLAWKLAAVLQGWGSAPLLDSYEQERRPAARRSVETSVEMLSLPADWPRRLISDGLVLGGTYDSSVIVADGTEAPQPADPVRDFVPTARPGQRAPHAWVQLNGERVSMLDLFGDRFVLLADAPQLATTTRAPLRVLNPSGDWRSLYGISDTGMVLVRPDGHVAARWASQPDDPAKSLDLALRIATGS
jgi:putative polyketide hydroxylase